MSFNFKNGSECFAMFMQKHYSICLLVAVAAVQVFFASGTPLKTVQSNEPEENGETGESHLEERGLFDYVPSPTNIVNGGLKSLDDNLRSARTLGTKALQNTVGSGVELATGFNPATAAEMTQEMMKKAIQGARYGTEAAYDATDKTLDTVQSLHDKKKQMLNDYVKPVAPTMVGNAIDSMNDRFESAMETVKNGSKMGRKRVIDTLANLEERLERGEQILPTSVHDGLSNAGKALGAGTDWVGSWVGAPKLSSNLPGLPGLSGLAGFSPPSNADASRAFAEEKAAAEAQQKKQGVKPEVKPEVKLEVKPVVEIPRYTVTPKPTPVVGANGGRRYRQPRRLRSYNNM